MAKIRKSKLSWIPSHSDQVIAYKLYWSKEDRVSYDSNYIELGDANEVYLPDIVKYVPPSDTSLWFGITAVDIDGNESDITHLAETYRVKTPLAPKSFSIKTIDDFTITDPGEEASEVFGNDPQEKELEALAGIAERLKRAHQQEAKDRSYDDEIYNKLNNGK